jgi:hypothetical protein
MTKDQRTIARALRKIHDETDRAVDKATEGHPDFDDLDHYIGMVAGINDAIRAIASAYKLTGPAHRAFTKACGFPQGTPVVKPARMPEGCL